MDTVVVYTFVVEVVNPFEMVVAYAATWSHLARADVELGLFDRAPCF
jgi:hypothetical protein